MGATKERVNTLHLSFVSEKWRKLLTPIAAVAVIAVILFFPRGQADNNAFVMSGQNPFPEEIEIESKELEEQITPTITLPVIVDVKGAVRHPGVYSLVEGDRLIDAINAAGGYLPTADSRMLNHAMKVVDELSIYVPIEGEEPLEWGNVADVSNSITQDDGRVNINKADEKELMTIPGIGPSKASSIIQHRLDHGPFKTTEALMEVSGIGQKTFEKLEQQIKVD